jgi:hypothetical protein
LLAKNRLAGLLYPSLACGATLSTALAGASHKKI